MTDDWAVRESVVEYETDWYIGGYDLVEHPDGSTKRYYWAKLPPAVVIVAEHDGEIVFVKQHRPAVGQSFLELPAGIVEDGESFEAAGARELNEETGFSPDTVELLQEYWVATGVLRHRRGVVVATELSQGEPSTDRHEFLDITTHPVATAIDRARAPPANDSTMTALLLAIEDGYIQPHE